MNERSEIPGDRSPLATAIDKDRTSRPFPGIPHEGHPEEVDDANKKFPLESS